MYEDPSAAWASPSETFSTPQPDLSSTFSSPIPTSLNSKSEPLNSDKARTTFEDEDDGPDWSTSSSPVAPPAAPLTLSTRSHGQRKVEELESGESSPTDEDNEFEEALDSLPLEEAATAPSSPPPTASKLADDSSASTPPAQLPESKESKEEVDAPLETPLASTNVSKPAMFSLPPPSSDLSSTSRQDPPMDEFPDDDFGDDGFGEVAGGDDDFRDFGDFGDFGNGDGFESMDMGRGEGDLGTGSSQPTPSASRPPPSSPPLKLPSELTHTSLLPLTSSLITTLYPTLSSSLTTDRAPSRIPLSPSTKALLTHLTSPPDSTLSVTTFQRSLTRRSYLQALGIPVNLEDFLEDVGGRMGKLEIDTGRTEASVAGAGGVGASGQKSAPVRGASSSVPARKREESAAGKKPEIDRSRIAEILKLNEDELLLLPLPSLKKLHAEISTLSGNTSSLLTWTLQLREKEQQDGEAYNSMISDLISSAAKMKTSKGSSKPSPVRRDSAKTPTSRWGGGMSSPSGRQSPAPMRS
ncbi:hypothetical protein BT69DRAFT_1354349 [Atractiella rhizophila]|nr:hypothetical protein BT69DRAFT_1354349 [Atractiella rhizophila]